MSEKIETAVAPWSNGLLLVCSKCGKKLQKNKEDPNQAEELKSSLKERLREKFGKSVRVVNSSCLDICPENRIALTYVKNGQAAKIYTASPEASPDEVIKEIF